MLSLIFMGYKKKKKKQLFWLCCTLICNKIKQVHMAVIVVGNDFKITA